MDKKDEKQQGKIGVMDEIKRELNYTIFKIRMNSMKKESPSLSSSSASSSSSSSKKK